MWTNPSKANRWDQGSSLMARVLQRPEYTGRDIYSIDWSKALGDQVSEDAAAYEASKRRWGVADRFATAAAMVPFAAAAPALFGVGGAGGASATASTVPAAAGPATATAGRLATLGKIFSSPGMELGVNSALSLFGQHRANKAADQARADQLAAQREALALERQRLEMEARNADLDREDARKLNDAINELKKRELDAAEEERAYRRGESEYLRSKDEAREARLTPYRNVSEAALSRLASMWGI